MLDRQFSRGGRTNKDGASPTLAKFLCLGLLVLASAILSNSVSAQSLRTNAKPSIEGLADALDPKTLLPLGHLDVVGNSRAESLLVVRSAGFEIGYPAGTPAVRNALRSLYGLGLFSDIHILDKTEEGDETRSLAIVVAENPRVSEIGWVGNDKLGDEDLKSHIDLQAGDLLSSHKLFAARNALTNAYQDEGYAAASVEAGFRYLEQPGEVALTFSIIESERVKITSVRVEGSEYFSSEELAGKLQLKPNGTFKRKRYTAPRMREDEVLLVDYFHNNGFKDATLAGSRAEFSTDYSTVDLVYIVDEGPFYQFGEIEWSGNTAVSRAALIRAADIGPGEAYSREKVTEATTEAYNLYTEEGYLLELQIYPETRADSNRVHVTFNIREGNPSQVNEIKILGNTRTKERVVRRELTLVPGDLLRRSSLMRSHRDIFALGYFEDVGIDYSPTGEGSDIDVVLTVKEKSSGTATAGAGFSSDTGLTGFLEFGHNNLFGTGKKLNLHLERGGQRQAYDISFTEPWAFGTPTSVGFHVFNTQRDIDIYREKRRGFAINVGRPWFFKTPDFSRIFASYSLEDLTFTDFTSLDPASTAYLSASAGTVSRVTTTLSRNSTDNPFYPTSGSRTIVRVEFAGGALGGDIDYYKPVIDQRNYLVPFWKPTLMFRQRFGYVQSYNRGVPVPGNETFRLGGTRSDYLRGYSDWYVVPQENIRLGSNGQPVRFPGGKIMYVFTAEYQFPLVNPMRGLFFFDAGNTWNSMQDFSFSDLRKGAGFGVRMEIPLLGNVGFDYAYGIDRGRWQSHLIIGPAF